MFYLNHLLFTCLLTLPTSPTQPIHNDLFVLLIINSLWVLLFLPYFLPQHVRVEVPHQDPVPQPVVVHGVSRYDYTLSYTILSLSGSLISRNNLCLIEILGLNYRKHRQRGCLPTGNERLKMAADKSRRQCTLVTSREISFWWSRG